MEIARRLKQSVERFAETGAGDVKRLPGIDPPKFHLRASAEIRASPQAPCNINLGPVLVPNNCKPCARSKLQRMCPVGQSVSRNA